MKRCAGCGTEDGGEFPVMLKRCACRRVYFCGRACMGAHIFCRARQIVARWRKARGA